MELESRKIADSRTEMNELVMPNDTNALGNLMGGNLMRWMDIGFHLLLKDVSDV